MEDLITKEEGYEDKISENWIKEKKYNANDSKLFHFICGK